ncbi:MAG: LON peptidase substrate-binding domain-containing protein, partial [Planococcus sp. (in: Bacteria)]|nr:LON peptidase substrate-binding domain-containing protein [Planococcus sp. (in: firmicutes)]
MAKKKVTKSVPLLPLRGLLVFPTMVLHIDVGRERSVAALEQALLDDNIIFLATQKDMSTEQPEKDDLHKIGTLAYVKQMLKLPNGTIRVLVEGLERGQMKNYEEGEDFTIVEVTSFPDETERDAEQDALMRLLLEHFENYAKSSKKVSTETYNTVADIEEPGRLADMVASHLSMKVAAKQEVLETFDISKRLELLITRLHSEQEVVDLEKRINLRVKKAMEQTQ